MRAQDAHSALLDPAGALISFAKCFGAFARNVVYVSVPITTGRRYLEWRISCPSERDDAALDAAHRRDVMAQNISAAEHVVQYVRSNFSGVVVDPTQLDDIDGWVQRNYHGFWANFIEKFVERVVFADGWQYSTGCSIELIAAYRNGIEALDQRLEPLEPDLAAKLLRNAVKEFEDAELHQNSLRESSQSMDEISVHFADASWK